MRTDVNARQENARKERQRNHRAPALAAAIAGGRTRTALMDDDMHQRPTDRGLVQVQRPGVEDGRVQQGSVGGGAKEIPSHGREHQSGQRHDARRAVDLPGREPPHRDPHRKAMQDDGHGKRSRVARRQGGQCGPVER